MMTKRRPANDPKLEKPVAVVPLRIRLYIALPTPTSLRARTNLQEIVESLGRAEGEVSVEIVDVTANPLRALRDRIIVTPSLTICDDSDAPPVIGDFSNAAVVRDFIEAALRRHRG
jgi:circadian clock protein KaiB